MPPSVPSDPVEAPGDTRSGPCENCDRPDEGLVAVHRVYLDPDDLERATVLDEAEWWCVGCRSTYPHRLPG